MMKSKLLAVLILLLIFLIASAQATLPPPPEELLSSVTTTGDSDTMTVMLTTETETETFVLLDGEQKVSTTSGMLLLRNGNSILITKIDCVGGTCGLPLSLVPFVLEARIGAPECLYEVPPSQYTLVDTAGLLLHDLSSTIGSFVTGVEAESYSVIRQLPVDQMGSATIEVSPLNSIRDMSIAQEINEVTFEVECSTVEGLTFLDVFELEEDVWAEYGYAEWAAGPSINKTELKAIACYRKCRADGEIVETCLEQCGKNTELCIVVCKSEKDPKVLEARDPAWCREMCPSIFPWETFPMGDLTAREDGAERPFFLPQRKSETNNL